MGNARRSDDRRSRLRKQSVAGAAQLLCLLVVGISRDRRRLDGSHGVTQQTILTRLLHGVGDRRGHHGH